MKIKKSKRDKIKEKIEAEIHIYDFYRHDTFATARSLNIATKIIGRDRAQEIERQAIRERNS